MAGGSLGDNMGLKEELITVACGLAFQAHTAPGNLYRYNDIGISSEAYRVFSFSGSWDAAEWFVNKPFGETKIDLALFPSLRSIGNDEAALVNEGFAKRFDNILKTTTIKSEVNKAMVDRKQVVFTGHSSGAAMAILATFWALEEYLNPTKTHNHKPPFCVTFGSPLIGNHIFSHASRRENWSRCFIHFVLRYDIVPRILLAPFSSIEQTFSSILQFLDPMFGPDRRGSVISEFYSTVMRNAATVTSHAAGTLMGSTNLLFETVTNFVDLSPYRPFGTYVFCNGNGQLIVVRNSDAVLQLMFHTAQLSNLEELPEVANNSISQHLAYVAELQESLGMQNVVYLEQLENFPCLRMVLIVMLQQLAQPWMALDWEHKRDEDFHANVTRLELAGVWDEIIEKLRSYELPDEFEGKKEWVDLGTRFRLLVEPLDIANYYRHARHYEDGSSSYMVRGRPKRYRYTQRWLEHAERRPQEPSSTSCFFAEVEDLRYKTSKSNSSFEDVKERVERLEVQIKTWSDEGKLAKDVFLEGSVLVKWWKTLPPQHKQQSCIRSLINE
ncbi:EDS1L protein [Spatholobus suberectus]|nr:EDS1L protein [Spatholobus suberectus]